MKKKKRSITEYNQQSWENKSSRRQGWQRYTPVTGICTARHGTKIFRRGGNLFETCPSSEIRLCVIVTRINLLLFEYGFLQPYRGQEKFVATKERCNKNPVFITRMAKNNKHNVRLRTGISKTQRVRCRSVIGNNWSDVTVGIEGIQIGEMVWVWIHCFHQVLIFIVIGSKVG